MRTGFLLFLGLLAGLMARGAESAPAVVPDAGTGAVEATAAAGGAKVPLVYIVPIRSNIDKAMVYLVRRGVKEAMAADADLLLVDMDTNGGEVGATQKIIQSLAEFDGRMVTYINHKALSAGALISVSTPEIYMAPESVIGAAAVVMMAPGGGAEDLPGTMKLKMTSALSALTRAQAQKHGHNPDVVHAMIDENAELKIGEEVLSAKGELLTLTARDAAARYVMEEGGEPVPLLSAGTVADLDALVETLGFAGAKRERIEPTGAEVLAGFLIALGPVLLIVGAVGLYIEFKTPGFGVPGVVGVMAFCLYFLGGYAAGLSGMEWVLVFILGLALVAVELFLFPGTIVIGLSGTALMLTAVIMALVDLYPSRGPGPGLPTLPSFGNPFQLSLRNILIAMVGTAVAVWILSRILPKTSLYGTLVLAGTSGTRTEAKLEEVQRERMGQTGVAVSGLRPGGKIRIGDDLVDVSSLGDFVEAGAKVRIVDYRNNVAVVEVVPE